VDDDLSTRTIRFAYFSREDSCTFTSNSFWFSWLACYYSHVATTFWSRCALCSFATNGSNFKAGAKRSATFGSWIGSSRITFLLSQVSHFHKLVDLVLLLLKESVVVQGL